jgi:ankyrin repeat protein
MQNLILIFGIAILLQYCGNQNTSQIQEESHINSVSKKLNPDSKTSVDNEPTKSNCTKLLIDAVRINDSIRIKKILSNGCDVNQKISTGHNYYAKDSTYETPLSQSTNYEITKLLLEFGANPNIELGTRSPLESIVFQNRNDIAKLLIENGADVNHFNKFTEFQNPLIAAISTGNIEALKILIGNKAKFKSYEENIHEPLHKAIRHERLEVAEFLIQSGISTRTKITPRNLEGDFGDCVPCPFEIEPIHSAAQITNPELAIRFIDLLVSNNADINAENNHGESPISYIAAKGNPKVGQYLISKGAKISSGSISTAAAYQNNEYLRILLSNGGNPNTHVKLSPLHQAIFCCGDGFNDRSIDKRIETVKILLEYGAIPPEELIDKLKNEERLKSILSIFEKHRN